MSTACATTSSSSSKAASASSSYTPALKLALGTIKLENTGQAVDSSTAAQLLPLWQLLAELKASSSAAPQEIEAVVEQIQATMLPDQIKAISAMHLAQSDIDGESQSGGATKAAATSGANNTNAQAAAAAGSIMGGGMPPAGGDPGGGPMPGGTSQQSSSVSKSASSASAPSLIDQVIQLLESKIKA